MPPMRAWGNATPCPAAGRSDLLAPGKRTHDRREVQTMPLRDARGGCRDRVVDVADSDVEQDVVGGKPFRDAVRQALCRCIHDHCLS
jgi:hypothetical protein